MTQSILQYVHDSYTINSAFDRFIKDSDRNEFKQHIYLELLSLKGDKLQRAYKEGWLDLLVCFPILLGEGPDEEQWDGIELDRGGYHLFKEVYDDFEAHLYCELLTPNEEEYIRGILENIIINN